MTRAVFPLTALVGQEAMTLALLLNAVSPQIGGVLVRGQRGTAKSTAARGLAALLPDIEVVDGCSSNCDPVSKDALCGDCLARLERDGTLPATRRAAPFVDLPVGASEDRVAGSFDLESAIQRGTWRFRPGLLASANRGVLYVDEVNLLEDHLVDLLLDAAASGVNVVEREGMSYRHSSRFMLVGTMNPEEGELRPQLLDRFGLCVDVTAATGPGERVAILERCMAFERNPDEFLASWRPREREMAARLAAARAAAPSITFDVSDLSTIAGLVSDIGVEGHRAELVTLRAACAVAALEGRTSIADGDLIRVAPLALVHRIEAGPVDEPVRALGEIAAYVSAARRLAGNDDGETGKKKRLTRAADTL